MQWHKQSNFVLMSSLVLLLQTAHSLTTARKSVVDELGWPPIPDHYMGRKSVVDELGWPPISDHDMGHATNELRSRAQAKALHGNTSMAIHIGPNDLDNYEVEAYKFIMQDAAWRVAFVEPQANKLEQCRQKMDNIDALRGRSQFVNAAVCRNTGQEHVYSVSPSILEDIPCRHSKFCDVNVNHNFSEISSCLRLTPPPCLRNSAAGRRLSVGVAQFWRVVSIGTGRRVHAPRQFSEWSDLVRVTIPTSFSSAR